MAFSGSSYFAGIGTVFAAIAFGVACGSMVTTSVVQPPNRLERLKDDATDQSKRDSALHPGSSSAERASTAKPVSQDAPPSPVVAAAPAVSADPKPAPSAPPSAAPAAVKAGAAATTQDHSAARDQPAPAPAAKGPTPSTAAKSEDAAPANNEHASTRSIDSSRQSSHRRSERRSSDDRKFSERRRRHDQDQRQQDEASNVVQPMPRGRTVDEIVEPDDRSRFGTRPRHFGLFGDDDPPRRVDGPSPGFGFLFGD